MFPAITTTHAIPPGAPRGRALREGTAVHCCHCATHLGEASDRKMREELQASHQCSAKSLAKKPAASVPYN